MSTLLVTGGAGFIGCNLSARLAEMGHTVHVVDNLSRPGVERNAAFLRTTYPRRVAITTLDVRDGAALADAAAGADVVFHLAAQVAVTTSLTDPMTDYAVNVHATVQLLEAMRRGGARTPFLFASTNKVYGDLADVALSLRGDAWQPEDDGLRGGGIDERRPLDFHTPYGCSKGAADQYVLDYARSFGLPAVVLRMSCIYGTHQQGTEDQGWVAHFLRRALAGQPITLYGDGRQVRDILFVDDCVSAYVAAWQRADALRGRAFNLGGGPANAVSLRQVIAAIEAVTSRPVDLSTGTWRAGDQRWFVADPRAAQAALGLAPPLGWRDGLARLCAWYADVEAHDVASAAGREAA